MTAVQIAIYLVFICLEIFSISFFMETYKKTIRKDKASVLEVRAVGLGLSVLATLLLWGIGIIQPILGLLGSPLWVDLVLYSVVIFYLQLQSDMVIVKKLLKAFVPTLLNKIGLDDKTISEIVDALVEGKKVEQRA